MAKRKSKKASKNNTIGLGKIIFTLAILTIVVIIGWRIKKNPASDAPYPYKISGQAKTELIDKAKDAQILFIGDRLGAGLDKFIQSFNQAASKNISEPLKIYNMSRDGLGLHRILNELKSLPKLPSLIIYYGSTQEFFETRAHPLQYQDFLFNKKIQDEDILSSVFMAFPDLSRVLYNPYTFYEFDLAAKPNSKVVIGAGPGKIEQMEMIFQIYEWELLELTKYVKENNSKLVLITSPINLDVPPKANCSLSEEGGLQIAINEMIEKLKNGKSKEVYDELKVLKAKHPSHARLLYLFGSTALEIGKTKEAKEALTQAATFDCATWRGSPVFNQIMRKVAAQSGLPLVDFDSQLNAMYGQNVLFFDEVNPQNIYTKAMLTKLGELTIRLLGL